MSFSQAWIYLPNRFVTQNPLLPSFLRVSVENQILKYGFTTREIIILENDDPGGVFEFSPSSRGPYSIKVTIWVISFNYYRLLCLTQVLEKAWILFFYRKGSPSNSRLCAAEEVFSGSFYAIL